MYRQQHTTLIERAVRALNVLEQHLASNTFFVGERITLADIVVAAFAIKANTLIIDAALRPKFPNLIRHLETVANQPQLKDLFTPIPYVEKAVQFTPPAKEKKEPKAAPAPAKKEEKKPKKEEDDDEEDAAPAAPKVKNPLDDLPKSTLVLDDWKRAYSNLDTRGAGGAIEWFYKK